MKSYTNSLVKALFSVVFGALLIKYREEAITWITIALGVCFFIVGVFVCVFYYASKNPQPDAVVTGEESKKRDLSAVFPFSGVGSIVLGIVLALQPEGFGFAFVYIIAGLLIFGALTQFIALSEARHHAHIGAYFWVMPTLIMLTGLTAIAKPSVFATSVLFILGWTLLIYGIVEIINALSIHRVRKIAEKSKQPNVPPEREQLEDKEQL